MITINDERGKPTPIIFNDDLSSTAKLILYTIERIIAVTGKTQFSEEFIAQCAGLARETVSRHLPALEEAGYLTVERGERNSRTTNTYAVTDNHALFVDPPEEKNQDNNTPVSDPPSPLVEKLEDEHGPDRVAAAIRYIKQQQNLRNPIGFLIWLLRGNSKTVDLDQLERDIWVERNPGLKYVSGKYAAFIVA